MTYSNLRSSIALSTMLLATPAAVWAATVTATFDGEVSSSVGYGEIEGAPVTVTITADTNATPMPDVDFPFDASDIQFAERAAFTLSSLTLGVPEAGLAVRATSAIFYVVDNVLGGDLTDPLDILYAFGTNGDGSQIEYQAAFDGDTFSGVSLQNAIQTGLANAPVITQSAAYTGAFGDLNGACIGEICELEADVDLTDLLIEGDDDDVVDDPSDEGDDVVVDDTTDDEDDDVSISVVPLPASAGFLLFGLGSLAVAARRRN